MGMMLTTDAGKTLSIDQRSFTVDYLGGCDATSGTACSGQGVCHLGYCVCFDGYYGNDCSATIDRTSTSATVTATEGGSTAYRMRRDALVFEKLAEARDTNNGLRTIKQDVLNKLDAKVYDASSAHKTTISTKKAAIDTDVEALYLKKERNTIR